MPPPTLGTVQHVDDRASRVRNLKLHPAAPKRLRAEELIRGNVMNDEGCALNRLLRAADRTSRIDEDRPEHLFGKVPMLGRTGSADITRLE